MDRVQEKIQKNKDFLAKSDVKLPLLGCYIGGWEDLGRYSTIVDTFVKPGIVSAQDIEVESFRKVYDNYRNKIRYANDDFIRCFEPVSSIPWAEAALGCPVEFTGRNFWTKLMGTEEFARRLKAGDPDIRENGWIKKYGEFIDFFVSEYPDIPVGQAILRGSLDMLCAAISEEETIYAFVDDPDFVHDGLRFCEGYFEELYRIQAERTPLFHGGSVMGMYYLWFDKSCCRIQQDAIAVTSPDLYRDFIHRSCLRQAAISPRCLFHTHATTNFVMDQLCDNPYVDVVQVTKDEGNTTMEEMVAGMEIIQKAGKGILFKGKVTEEDLRLLSRRIDKRGLAVGMVVESEQAADEAMAFARSLRW